MSRADPARLLLRALRRSAAAAGCTVTLEHQSTTPWASATFVGAQHRVAIGGASAAWLDALADADLPIPGHLVASLDVAAHAIGATLTVLVLET